MIDVSKFASISAKLRVPFGLDKARASIALREMADGIESGDILVQGVNILGDATIRDFTTHTLLIEYAVKVETAP